MCAKTGRRAGEAASSSVTVDTTELGQRPHFAIPATYNCAQYERRYDMIHIKKFEPKYLTLPDGIISIRRTGLRGFGATEEG